MLFLVLDADFFVLVLVFVNGIVIFSFLVIFVFVFVNENHTARHTPVFTWRPRIFGHRSSGVERLTSQCHLYAVSVIIPTTFENFSVSATSESIITVSWS